MEETAKYETNDRIYIISADEAREIIEIREPRGLFLYIEDGEICFNDRGGYAVMYTADTRIIGIDNRTGDAWTEEFDTYEDCVKWLIDPNREAQEEAEPMHYNYPRIKFVESSTIFEQLRHVESELQEIKDAFCDEKFIEEIVDLHHSVETLIRILMEQEGVDIEKYRRAVIEKNRKRGYYGEEE